jgi:hypothetical protein
MWSRSGRELFFESLDNRIMVAGYTVQGDSFMPDKPRLWSEKALANRASKNIDLAPDGKQRCGADASRGRRVAAPRRLPGKLLR